MVGVLLGCARYISSMALLFLDFDDVICLNNPYGGYDLAAPDKPADLYERLWHPPALQLLQGVVQSEQAQVVLTTSWLRFLLLEDAKDLFHRTGAPWLAEALHPAGEALSQSGWTRLRAIDAWLAQHWERQPYAILDDALSGTGLAGSSHDRAGRVVLCNIGVGMQPRHLEQLHRALKA
jgi:hypothetical protein